jgi:hypothetical protein
VYYKLLTLIPVSAALIGFTRYADSILWPLLYIGLCLTHAGIMYAIKCPHCAYYKMSGKTHRCFIWWGVPKLFEPREGPESKIVGVYAPIGMLVLALFPVYWLWNEWALLLLYLLGVVVLAMSIGSNECPRCLNFQCSHNTVPEELRKEYLEWRPEPGATD